jgi:hypothetical protein
MSVPVSLPRLPREARPVPRHFESLLPAIRRQARHAFRRLPRELREELIAEAVAQAYCAFRRLVERGHGERAFATPLARFAVRHVRAGRRVGTPLNKHDVSSYYGQRAHGMHLERLDRCLPHERSWLEIAVEDRAAGPAETAAFRLDFEAWLSTLGRQRRRIALALARGEATGTAARRFDLSPARISQLRRELRDHWRRFQGEGEEPVAGNRRA